MSNIPKIIHYCWFGNGKKSKLANKCMESWRVKLKNYEIIEWNEKNFDINCNKYVKEAYNSKNMHLFQTMLGYLLYIIMEGFT